ncbi:Protein required for ethanol metabolism [Komagataella phaffii CBS 7435]|uniref:Protein SYM1 n=2 Tax=Komagataella phaffii TaxID=460519 RepID=C4R2B6_KOMPG|nr:Protein required for ethanol metabolism [Komagataella phaffii GS115]AOA62496.1 GQ67_01060T0 [Komagataella phaffii]CAH2447808.1 Protein required for ethanol metabolism [Komagataella phaffii CBS 7435]AOA67461.1 GQ68_00329T0 [Komagataella phaffii GS115]CAY69640.1 Protein required for ethanol metabolism [Komagataella phaffii GS115]CCA37979.1 Protein required for ethanol metabolism [Komagataella phaffii CBS 7435]
MLLVYNNFLQRNPIITNGLTTGFLFGTGDVLAQTLYSDGVSNFDYKRTLRAVVYGGIIFAPIGDRWYKLLNGIRMPVRLFKSEKSQKVSDTIARVAVDQLVWAPVGIPLYYSCMAMMEGLTIQQWKQKLDEKYMDTLFANWKVWPLFQLANFYVFPVQHRLLAVNVISIIWNCYLSAKNSGVLEDMPVIEDGTLRQS